MSTIWDDSAELHSACGDNPFSQNAYENTAGLDDRVVTNASDIESSSQQNIKNNYGSTSYADSDSQACLEAYSKCSVGVSFHDDDDENNSRNKKFYSRLLSFALVLLIMTPLAYYSGGTVNGASNVSNLEIDANMQGPLDFSRDNVDTLDINGAFPVPVPVSVSVPEVTTVEVDPVSGDTEGAAAPILECRNEYGSTLYNKYSVLPYPGLAGKNVIEPYKDHKCYLDFDGVWVNFSDVEWSLKLDLTGEEIKSGKVTLGSNGLAIFDLKVENAAGHATITFTQNDLSAEVVIAIKFVRREIHTLTPEDRELFLDTMHVLWTTDTETGKKLYGDDYKSIAYFAQIHNEAPVHPSCDQFHAGTGFIHNHVYFEAYFEQSLRSVNPAAVVHYLEYGELFSSDEFKFNHRYNSDDGGAWTDVMGPDWFGSTDPATGFLLNSRWKDYEVLKVTTALKSSQNHGVLPKLKGA